MPPRGDVSCTPMSLSGFTVEDLKANIRDAKDRAEAALANYEAALAELAWWQQGLKLVDPQAAAADGEALGSEGMVAELFPDGFAFDNGKGPTLRQAIVLVMREHPGMSWTINHISMALDRRGWMPQREDARKRISDMAGLMYDSGQLSRLGRGIYKLSPPLAAALDAARGGQE
jgi:hypothetical protein